MIPRTMTRTFMLAGAVFLPAALVSSSVDAQQTEPAAAAEAGVHRHEPVDIDARPIVARSKITLVRPRRLLLDPEGNLFIADWAAGTVLKVTPDEKVSVFAEDLHEPAGLARDAVGNLYVAVHAEGMTKSGGILRIAPTGEPSWFVEGLTGPTALAFDSQGTLFVASFEDNSIQRVAPTGEVSTFLDDIPTPSALAFDAAGQLFVASSTEGTVYRIGPMGDVQIVTRSMLVPSDLAFDNEGHLIVANYGGTELSYVDEKGLSRPYAVVPKGTIAHLFDAEGNLLLVNWDFQFLMKVTNSLSVPCPHCGKPIPVRLRPKTRNEKPVKTPII